MSTALRNLLRIITSFFAIIFGQISWNCPPWLSHIKRKVALRPWMYLTMVGLVVVLSVLAWGGYGWYKKLPRPKLITAKISAPEITPLTRVLVPDDLKIEFGIEEGSLKPQSVAPLKKIGKEVTEGITLTPAMPGKWVWRNDSELVFTPSKDWPADQTYQIQFAKNVF